MYDYESNLKQVLDYGTKKTDRTGIGTLSCFGLIISYNIRKKFPLITSKHTSLRNIFYELNWFLSGDTNIKYLVDNKVNIWNDDCYRYYLERIENKLIDYRYMNKDIEPYSYQEFFEKIKTDLAFAYECGDLGKVYGYQWRKKEEIKKTSYRELMFLREKYSDLSYATFALHPIEQTQIFHDYNESVFYTKKFDQIKYILHQLRNNPDSRRIYLNAWSPTDLDECSLPPCHVSMQFFVRENKYLSCLVNQRSADMFLGVPYNLASYALLTYMLAHQLNFIPDELTWIGGDCHIYNNHLDQAAEVVKRADTHQLTVLPGLKFKNKPKDIFSYKYSDLELEDYNPLPRIPAPLNTGMEKYKNK